MSKKHFIITGWMVTCLALAGVITAQTTSKIYGIVTNTDAEILIGASVSWADRQGATVTNTEGQFWLPSRSKPDTIVVQYIGYQPIRVEVLPHEDSLWIELSGVVALQGVTIEAHRFDNATSTLGVRNVERITSQELRKAPCCNLSESFETNGAVDLSFSNALTGVKEIQMLGLRGIYTQLLIDTRPTMGGIATPFALEMIPGTWLSGISIAKGASTVRQGNAGIAGQISADLVRPAQDYPVFVNLFTSTEGRAEANIHLNKKLSENAAHGLFLHGSMVKNQWDMNRDTFYDMPNRHQLNALYRFILDTKSGWCTQFNVQALTDERLSGQIRPLYEQTGPLFAVNQRNDRVEAWAKFGKEGINGKPYQQMGNIFSGSWHRVRANYGPNYWAATQQSLFWQSLFESIIGTTDHKWVVAPSIQYDQIVETVNENILDRREFVPGLMGEYTYSRPDHVKETPGLVVVAGGRVDWNSRFNQWMYTPRISAKYNFTSDQIVRVSVGRGYRSPNLMAENISLLASNRSLRFGPDLGLESARNYGANYTQNMKIGSRPTSLSVDFYRTEFQSQILVDVDTDPREVRFYNVPGASYATSILAVWQVSPFKGFDAKMAYKWQDTRADFADGKRRLMPLLPQHRGLVTLDYTTPNKRWMFNVRSQIMGAQRLPDNSRVPHELVHDFPAYSPVYSLWNGQITYKTTSKMEFYLGGENLTNFQQHHAIIAANDPQSPYFNGAQLWAPMGGAIVYLGVRYSPSGLKE
jgi:outer membrane receptor for ferrienterochelin and colicins